MLLDGYISHCSITDTWVTRWELNRLLLDRLGPVDHSLPGENLCSSSHENSREVPRRDAGVVVRDLIADTSFNTAHCRARRSGAHQRALVVCLPSRMHFIPRDPAYSAADIDRRGYRNFIVVVGVLRVGGSFLAWDKVAKTAYFDDVAACRMDV